MGIQRERPCHTAAQRLIHERAAEARHLAWNLLRAGLDDAATAAE